MPIEVRASQRAEQPARSAGRVAVLMATYNGERFLDAQLASLAAQSLPAIDLIVSDDGSRDDTRALLSNAQRRWDKGRFEIVDGPRQGFAENFRSLICREVEADYIAFCDQDDLWDVDKLAKALVWLDNEAGDAAALHCGRTRSLKPDGTMGGLSPLFPKPPCFRNALVQSIAGGNTMVMNRKAYECVVAASVRTPFVSHDWWSYAVVSGTGGKVHYTAEPAVLYRQHEENLIGENNSWGARLLRLRGLLDGRFKEWMDRNIEALGTCRDLLDEDAIYSLDQFQLARSRPVYERTSHLRRSGVFRQTARGQAALYAACLAGLL